ncbi:MAG: DNA gyrase subunit A [Magnetovibrionaceae bacterium]
MTSPPDTPPEDPSGASPSGSGFDPVTIEEEMRKSYLDYAMSVIVSRALPDARDGLKPVHRRIIHSMNENGFDATKPYRKSARIVGEVMGRYHPHGDQAIYDAMVRMAQPFAMRLMLVDGQGNFGSMDGDKPAAMRYTEARMAKAAHALIDDIDMDTVDFQPNYDETAREPIVLPARFPNLLVNGAGGIAVGMATNIPPHNLGEMIDACKVLIERPETTIEELMETIVPGPDFPTGGLILGRTGIRNAFMTGRGSVIMRGKTEIEDIRKDRQAIIVTEVPYQVNKARMIEIMAECVRDKKIEGISDLRDESDRHGIRVVIEIKRDHMAEVVLNQLFRFTPLQTTFGVNMLALDGGRPRMMNLKEMLVAFIAHREEVIRRRTAYLLGKARDKAHVLAGLAVAVANVDEVIRLIREAADPQEAREALMARNWPAQEVEPFIALLDDPGHAVVDGHYKLSEAQAKAILDLRLHRLTGLERDKIGEDLKKLCDEIEELLHILGSRERLYEVMVEELDEVRENFADERRTQIEENEFEHDIEDLIQREDMVVTVSNAGYIKRVPVSAYRAQKRGGKGRAGMATKDEDFVEQVYIVNTHTPVLFFSSAGMVYKLKVYRLPLGNPQSKGKALVNLLPLSEGETISTVMPLPEDEDSWNDLFVLFATASGGIRRNRLSDFTNVMANGKIAMKLDEGDWLVRVRTASEDDDVLIATAGGKCIRFPVPDVRVFSGRTSTGVRAIKLAKDDQVIGLSCVKHFEVETEQRDAYLQSRNAARRLQGGDYTDRAGDLAKDRELAARLDEPAFQEMLACEEFLLTVTDDGFGKRTSAYEYRTTARGGQGISNMDLKRSSGEGAGIASVFVVLDEDQIVMVSNSGQIIRCPVDGISFSGRAARGVTLFNVAEGERVVSVSRLRDMEGDDEGEGAEEEAESASDAAEPSPSGEPSE